MQIGKYIQTLKDRNQKGGIYKEYQSTGLYLARLLGDQKYKALYIKLAKYNNQQELYILAKYSTEKSDVKNPAGYFMKMAKERGFFDKIPKHKSGQQKMSFKKAKNVNKNKK